MKRTKVPHMDGLCVTQVIISNTKRRGKGIEGDPIRVVTEVFTLDGKLIAEYDPYKDNKQN